MRMDKDPVEETKGDDESSDFGDTCDVTPSSSPRRTLSSSLSSLEGGQTGVDDSDNDSGFAGVSRGSLDRLDIETLDATRKINGSCLGVKEKIEKYDREAILRELASSSNKNKTWIIQTFEELRKTCAKAIPQMSDEEELYEELRKILKPIPDSMLHLLPAVDRPGDCARPSGQKPDWLDMEKLRRGQKFAQDHMFPVYFAEILSLFVLFSFEDGLKPLIVSGKSSTPYTAFKRYLSTGLRIRNWYTEDPWVKGTPANKDILAVRAMHAAARRRLECSSNDEIDALAEIKNPWSTTREMALKDFSESCTPPAIGQCPHMMQRNSPLRAKGISMTDMALTQWGFIGLIVSYPKHLGVHNATDEDLEAFCHLWRSIGYQLGMEDEYNFCRGTLDDIRQRSNEFIETWAKPTLREVTPEWEHMMRCVISGTGAFMPGVSFETALLYLSEMFDLPMPRLYASLSYWDWFNFNLTKSLFYYSIRIPGVAGFFNNLLNRILDRGAQFTPEEIEALRIKLEKYPGNDAAKKNESPVVTNS